MAKILQGSIYLCALQSFTTKSMDSFKCGVSILFTFCCLLVSSQEIVLHGDISLVQVDTQKSLQDNTEKIITYGGATLIVNTVCPPSPKSFEKQKIKKIKKVHSKILDVKATSTIVCHFTLQENQSSFSMQGISLKNAVQNTRENTAKMLLFSSTVQLENRLLQIKKIERTFSFVRYQYSRTYTSRAPPYST